MSKKKPIEDQAKDNLKEGYKETRKILSGSATKNIILLILTFVFPAGGFMLAYNSYDGKSPNKNSAAKAYFFVALVSVIISLVLKLLGFILRRVIFPFWWF